MRGIILFGLAVSAVLLLTVATPVQADYVTAVTAATPFEWYRMQETAPVNTASAVNSGGTGIAGAYATTAANFLDATGMNAAVTPGKQFGPGTSTAINLSAQGSAYGTLSAFTIEFLFKPASYVGDTKALYAVDSWWTPGDTQVNLNGSMMNLAVQAGNATPEVDIATAAPIGQWSHIAVTYAASGGSSVSKFYVNGNLLGSFTGGSGSTANFNEASFIGRAPYWGERHVDGAMDEFAVYDYALGEPTIANHASLVPEPGMLALLATGLLGLLAYAWRKRK